MRGEGTLAFLILAAVALWFAFGDPKQTVANHIWPEGPAPWEAVDAMYYPDSSDLTVSQSMDGFKNVDACRAWVRTVARQQGDPDLSRSDYECGVGFLEMFGSIKVYRLTVR